MSRFVPHCAAALLVACAGPVARDSASPAESALTADSTAPETETAVHTGDSHPEGVDADGDGFPVDADCDDTEAGVFPGSVEVPYDGIDQDCDGEDAVDLDADGTAWPDDCDDADATVFPGAGEACDGRDEDCDGRVDEMVAGGTHDTVQGAIDAACADGDTVWVAAGTWVENVTFGGRNLLLRGVDGAEATVLDGSDCTRGVTNCSVLVAEQGEISEVEGVTLARGRGSERSEWWPGTTGGGVLVVEAALTLRDCVLADSVVGYGGGGAAVFHGLLTLEGVTATGNFAVRGGGAAILGSETTLIVNDSVFTDNIAEGYGGGVFGYTESTFAISDSTMSGNEALTGAGLETWEGGTLDRCTISANIASSLGGGVMCGGVITGADDVVSANVPDDVWDNGGCWQAGSW